MTESELQKSFIVEIVALEESGAALPLIFSPSEAFYLLSLLQLVLRHPGMQGLEVATYGARVAAFGKRLAEEIEQRLCKSPAMQEVARRGWNPEYDQRTDGQHGSPAAG